MVLNGLNPSLVKPSLTLRDSLEKSGWSSSKSFHALPSAGCLNFPSFERSSSCHLIDSAVFEHMNNLCSLGINGKCLKTFAGTLQSFLGCSDSHPSVAAFCFHREASQIVQELSFSCSFQNSMQSFGHASIFL